MVSCPTVRVRPGPNGVRLRSLTRPPPLIRPGVGVMQHHDLGLDLCGLREGRQTQLPPARVWTIGSFVIAVIRPSCCCSTLGDPSRLRTRQPGSLDDGTCYQAIPGGAKTITGGFKRAPHRPVTTSNQGQKNPAKKGCPAAPPGVSSGHAEDRGPLPRSPPPTVGIVPMSERPRAP
jgi:hypothetical protein